VKEPIVDAVLMSTIDGADPVRLRRNERVERIATKADV
jgi:hypothetical protein